MPTPAAEYNVAARAQSLRAKVRRAEPMLWLSAGAFVLALLLLASLLLLLATRGATHFWPQPLLMVQSELPRAGAQLGRVLEREALPDDAGFRMLLNRGGEDLFRSPLVWIDEKGIRDQSLPADALAIMRASQSPVFGFLDAIYRQDGWQQPPPNSTEQVAQIRALIDESGSRGPGYSQRTSLAAEPALRVRLASGQLVTLPLSDVLDAHAPNNMAGIARLGHFFRELWRFVSQSPRRSNIQGGVFPAIVGTVTLVMLMTLIVAPLGVLAAVYLQEYAQRTPITRLVRIAVNNLAGVPSIVYGVFGLGFFVYAIGGSLDNLLFAERLPAPTLGTPGMLWAALTMALLTLPVVIVATDEGLARVPISLREGSLALGATRAETLWRVVIPAASPAVLTGLILAVARATGEVAPLLLLGAAKYAPGLPVSGEFPYLHLDRQFMHLGFYIYDLGFQSPHLETAEGLVFATALLLVLIVLMLNFAAVILRSRLRDAFKPDELV